MADRQRCDAARHGGRTRISSAVLLKGGKIASVQVEVPETFMGPAGVEFRPFVSASTSFDGSISTQYGRMCKQVTALHRSIHLGTISAPVVRLCH